MSLDITRIHEQLSAVQGPPVLDLGHPSEALEVVDTPSTEREVAEDESQYPTGLKLFLVVFSAGLVMILANMDGSIVSVAVVAITDHFHTVQDVGWYSAAFRLAACSFQFMFGKLYSLFSFKRGFVTSVVIFIAGSTLCAAAQSSAMFVFGRAVCGFAFSGIVAGCFTLLVLCIPMRKRPLYTGLVGSIGALASISAPAIGGVIVDRLGWRWCFWIGLPLGFVTLLGIFFCISDVKPQMEVELTWAQRISKLDLVGNMLFVPSLTCLFIALIWAGSKYAWNSPTVIGLLCTFGVLLVFFGFDQYRKGDAAALPPRILYNRSVLAGLTYTLFCNSAFMVIEYYLPTYFQTVRGYSAAQSGYFQFPIVIGDILGVLFQSFGVSIIGYYTPFMLIGSILMPVFAGLMTTVTVKMALAEILVLSGFYGFAGGVGFLSPQSAVQMALPKADASMGLAVILFAEQFGPAVFVSAAQNIFQSRLTDNLHELVPSLNATGIEAMGLSDLKSLVGPEYLDDALLGFDKSLAQTWYLAVALACITMIGSATMEWKSVKQKRN
jgi:MFS family permease